MSDTPRTNPDDAVFGQCQSGAEVLLITHRLHGMAAVEQMLGKAVSYCSREGLRADADELRKVGLRDLAAVVRRHAKKAKPKPQRRWWVIADKAERAAAYHRQGGDRTWKPTAPI